MSPTEPELSWPQSTPPPLQRGTIRTAPADFLVRESLSFALTGEGTHHYLLLRKEGANTEWVAQQLARFCDLSPRSVGYAGRKDRRAITTQWFSVELPALRECDWQTLAIPGVTLLRHQRHGKKLRVGALRCNHFRLTVRTIVGDWQALETRLQQIRQTGVPNYFGPQRFGRQGENLLRAEALLRKRNPRRRGGKSGIYYSAARSALFNDLLARRVAENSWQQPVPGDVLMLAGSHSYFTLDQPDEATRERLQSGDLHLTGPLHGQGDSPARHDCLALEEASLAIRPSLKPGLERVGIKQDRRPLRVIPKHLAWRREGDDLTLAFTLPAGSYATALLAELIEKGHD